MAGEHGLTSEGPTEGQTDSSEPAYLEKVDVPDHLFHEIKNMLVYNYVTSVIG